MLAALFWAASLAAAAIAVHLSGEGRGRLAERIRLAERQAAALAALPPPQLAGAADLEARVAGLRGRLYAAGEIDPYRFGIAVRDLLRAQGLAIVRYQTVERGGVTSLEFSVEGSALALARFLEAVSQAPKWWAVSYLSLRAAGDGGSVQALLRVHYEQAGKAGG